MICVIPVQWSAVLYQLGATHFVVHMIVLIFAHVLDSADKCIINTHSIFDNGNENLRTTLPNFS